MDCGVYTPAGETGILQKRAEFPVLVFPLFRQLFNRWNINNDIYGSIPPCVT
jgi:hypothetical protein